MKRELIVGVVFTVLVGLLVGTTVWVEKPEFFRKKPAFTMTARFREVAGLKSGDEVWVYGTKAGRVKSIEPDGKGGVHVKLEIDYDPQMRENAEVEIGQRSALGGAIVSIHPGTPDRPLVTKEIFEGRSVADAFQEISSAIAELKAPIKDREHDADDQFALHRTSNLPVRGFPSWTNLRTISWSLSRNALGSATTTSRPS